jgi:DNA replication initiation complex subunit (GINS family)
MILFLLSWLGIGCWCVCFWWMRRISSRQDAMLKELHGMTTRIEKLSRSEHDLISDVHPQVSEIKEHVEDVRDAVRQKRADAGDSRLAEIRTSG